MEQSAGQESNQWWSQAVDLCSVTYSSCSAILPHRGPKNLRRNTCKDIHEETSLTGEDTAQFLGLYWHRATSSPAGARRLGIAFLSVQSPLVATFSPSSWGKEGQLEHFVGSYVPCATTTLESLILTALQALFIARAMWLPPILHTEIFSFLSWKKNPLFQRK